MKKHMFSKIKLVFILSFLGICLHGCGYVKEVIPENYNGKTAIIHDTYKIGGFKKIKIFYIKSINSQEVYNARFATNSASRGSGTRILASGANRKVPIQPLTLELIGTVYSAAPIISLMNSGSNYFVEGTLEFTPQPNTDYLVKGKLGEDFSAIWLEDISGNIVSNIITKPENPDIRKAIRNKNLPQRNIDNESRENIFSNISLGESDRLLVEKLGEPTERIEGKLNGFTLRKSPTRFIYSDLGTIYLEGKNEDSQLFVSKVKKKPKEVKKDIESIQRDLKSGSGQDLQRIARGHSKNKEFRIEALDLFIQKAWDERNSTDPHIIDAISIFCNIIGKSGNPRYKEALETISKNTTSKKLSKYARANSKRITQNNAIEKYTILQ